MLFDKQEKRITEAKRNKDKIANEQGGCIRVIRPPKENNRQWDKNSNQSNCTENFIFHDMYHLFHFLSFDF